MQLYLHERATKWSSYFHMLWHHHLQIQLGTGIYHLQIPVQTFM